jgi:hypothetical protein
LLQTLDRAAPAFPAASEYINADVSSALNLPKHKGIGIAAHA